MATRVSVAGVAYGPRGMSLRDEIGALVGRLRAVPDLTPRESQIISDWQRGRYTVAGLEALEPIMRRAGMDIRTDVFAPLQRRFLLAGCEDETLVGAFITQGRVSAQFAMQRLALASEVTPERLEQGLHTARIQRNTLEQCIAVMERIYRAMKPRLELAR